MKLNRNLYRAFLLLTFLALNGLIIYGISAVFSYLNTGADRTTMLHLPAKLTASYLPKVYWGTLNNEGRPMEKQTLEEIERDYLKSWYVKNNALETNNHYGVKDYFTDSARVKLFRILDFNKLNKTTIKTTTIEHHPTLEFYSADGKLVVLTDENVEQYSEVFKDGRPILKKYTTNSYKVMLLLEDGFWRVRHIVEFNNENLKEDNVNTREFNFNEIKAIKGLNYYPQASPWAMFGTRFNDSIISSDFKRINELGLNTVRLFIPFEDFGKGIIDNSKLQQVKTTLDIAQTYNLKVVITLFDFYGDYSITDWTLTHRHAEQIINSLKNHEALLAWDIKNEPDLDFESRGEQIVLAWLKQMINEIRKWDNSTPITIGWSTPNVATHLSQELDFVSFHYYKKPKDFLKSYQELRKTIVNKPIVLQEYGYSSYDGIWNAFLGSEEDQTNYYKVIQETLKNENVPFLFWTLYDFEEVPNSVVGRLPWRKKQQQNFGIIGIDGTLKPAYKFLENKSE